MAYAWERHKAHLLPLPGCDARVKLTDADRRKIVELWDSGRAIRSIAREYEDKCSRRLIQFVIFPERGEEAARLFKIRRVDGRYYKRDKHRVYAARHRQRKQKILEGK